MVEPRTNAEQGVVVLSSDGSELAPTTPAKARKLMDRGRAVPVRKDPFTIRLKSRKKTTKKEKKQMVLTHEGQPTVNFDTVCHVELADKKVMFFFTAMTARTNWNFETEEEAKAVYKNILEIVEAKDVSAKQ